MVGKHFWTFASSIAWALIIITVQHSKSYDNKTPNSVISGPLNQNIPLKFTWS